VYRTTRERGITILEFVCKQESSNSSSICYILIEIHFHHNKLQWRSEKFYFGGLNIVARKRRKEIWKAT
jgi:hypothetical protein